MGGEQKSEKASYLWKVKILDPENPLDIKSFEKTIHYRQGDFDPHSWCCQPTDEYKDDAEREQRDKSNPLPIKVKSFMYNYPLSYISGAMKYLKEKDAPFIIFDLRNNSGGDFWLSAHLLSYFIPTGTNFLGRVNREAWNKFKETSNYGCLKKRYDSQGHIDSNELWCELYNFVVHEYPQFTYWIRNNSNFDKFHKRKVSIFINKKTGCAAEVFIHTLRNYLGSENCVVIGEETKGGVMAVRTFESSSFHDRSYIFFPEAELILSDGTRLEHNPIQPDIIVKDDGNQQLFMDAAKDWFEKSNGQSTAVTSKETLKLLNPIEFFDSNSISFEQIEWPKSCLYGFRPLVDKNYVLLFQDSDDSKKDFMSIFKDDILRKCLSIGDKMIEIGDEHPHHSGKFSLIKLKETFLDIEPVQIYRGLATDFMTLSREGYTIKKFRSTYLLEKDNKVWLYGFKDSKKSAYFDQVQIQLSQEEIAWIDETILNASINLNSF